MDILLKVVNLVKIVRKLRLVDNQPVPEDVHYFVVKKFFPNDDRLVGWVKQIHSIQTNIQTKTQTFN